MPLDSPAPTVPAQQLKRELGVFGACMMGLGAMVGTGVFVSIGVAASISGSSVILAVLLAGVVALCNALSSAQLAASHAVSGGTYEYGYRYLTPAFGFSAGWMFLCAKSASAATAALGFSTYLLQAFGWSNTWVVPLAAFLTAVVSILVRSGMKRSSTANVLIVATTLAALGLFLVFALPAALNSPNLNFTTLFPADKPSAAAFLQSAALMFVAFTGYGRIATMGEEVRDPMHSIPKAILLTISISILLYLGVAIGIVSAPKEAVAGNAAPLEAVMKWLGHGNVVPLIAIGAMTAMLGVLLNLVLGLSRVVLAMGRRADFPQVFGRLDKTGTTPGPAVLAVGGIIIALCFIRDVKTTWSFSAFTVLVYYAITNLAALRMSRELRRYPAAFAWAGLVACLFLAFWVDRAVWISGLGLLAAGLVWQRIARWRFKGKSEERV